MQRRAASGDADATEKDSDTAVEELAELIMDAQSSLVAAMAGQLQPDGPAKASDAAPAAPSSGLRRSSRLRGQAAASGNSNGAVPFAPLLIPPACSCHVP